MVDVYKLITSIEDMLNPQQNLKQITHTGIFKKLLEYVNIGENIEIKYWQLLLNCREILHQETS